MNKYSKLSNKERVTAGKVRASFAAIFLLTIFAVLIVVPRVNFLGGANDWFSKFYIHLGLDLQGGAHLVYQVDLSEIEDSEKIDKYGSVRDRVEERVNVYGVSEAVVQTTSNDRIIVELPGVKDLNEAIAVIGAPPILDFRIQVAPEEGDPEIVTENDAAKQSAQDILDKALAGEDFATLAQDYSEDPTSAVNGGELIWVTRGSFVPEFDEAIFDKLSKGQIHDELVESQYGYHIIKKLDERLNDAGEIEVLSSHILIQKPNADLIWEKTGLSGKDVKKATLDFNPITQEPLVILEFNDDGKEMFAQLTTDHVGEPIGIFLDGILRSSPSVQEPITDGSAQISGSFSLEEAKSLRNKLNEGALDAPIKILSQQSVGATLGAASLQKSLLAGIIGLIAAALFMLLFYRLPGILSVIALAIYTVLALAIFELLPVTMTLAGIAGFILSIGMAVDANILIFERTKEELYSGKSLHTSIENGFSRAWPSIRDSNISSIITCLILAWFGTSIIKGFAITLAIGIMVSMFSAITISRTFLRMVVNKRLENKLAWFGVNKKRKE